MCSHCGSLWSKNKSQVRIISGKNFSKSVQQINKSCSEDSKVSRFRATLLKKCLKNKMNKVVIKCSICSKNTEVNCSKPKKLKLRKKDNVQADVLVTKKKKKKVKDKTAGLNVSCSVKSPDASVVKETTPTHSTPLVIKVKKSKAKEVTPFQKVRKMNLAKLNSVLDDSKVQRSRSSLSNFLKELY